MRFWFVDCLDYLIISFTDVKCTANVAKATAHPNRTPFTKSKNHGGGNFKKYAKGFLVGARPPTADRRRGSELAFCTKMGSSECVKSLQNGFFRDLVALTGGLFGGGAQRQPRVFQGGDLKLLATCGDFFVR